MNGATTFSEVVRERPRQTWGESRVYLGYRHEINTFVDGSSDGGLECQQTLVSAQRCGRQAAQYTSSYWPNLATRRGTHAADALTAHRPVVRESDSATPGAITACLQLANPVPTKRLMRAGHSVGVVLELSPERKRDATYDLSPRRALTVRPSTLGQAGRSSRYQRYDAEGQRARQGSRASIAKLPANQESTDPKPFRHRRRRTFSTTERPAGLSDQAAQTHARGEISCWERRRRLSSTL
jgi:hypothetical protein